MTVKKVSVIIPTYNYNRFIAHAISSCLDQTYGGIEIIVVDDGSTDDTRSVVNRFGDQIIYIYQENQGVSSARNTGLERATGDFVCFLDADDYLLPDAMESMAKVFADNPDVGIVIGQSYGKEEGNGEPQWHGAWDQDRVSRTLYEKLLRGNLGLTSPLMRGDLAGRFRFPPGITNGEDIAYYAKILFCSTAYLLAKPVLVIVRHPDCLHKNIETIAKQGAELIPTLLDDPLYGGAIEHLRNDIKALVYLSLFRSFYRSGRGRQGRKYYLQALCSKPGSIGRFSYFTKYLRTFFHSEPHCGTLTQK
jgi:glycosyltransferase involved in cell wall biosynthesis